MPLWSVNQSVGYETVPRLCNWGMNWPFARKVFFGLHHLLNGVRVGENRDENT